MKKKLGVSLMLAGIMCVAAAAALLIHNNNESKNAAEKSASAMSSLIGVIESETEYSLGEDPFDTEMLTASIDGYDYIGYLLVPCLELELPVMAECDDERLETAPCRYYGSTKTNNLVIAGHSYNSHFGYIGSLEAGDTVIFTDVEDKKITYKVTAVEILQPTDTDKVKDTGDDLIFFTCTYSTEERIAVRCKRV